MVQDLNFDIQIVGCPIIREEDGLAKSSRNTYLSEEERKAALCLSKAVKAGQETICKGIKAEEVLTKMREIIEAEPLAKNRKSQFFSYKIYWNYYHLLLCDRIFLARWVRVDNQLYIHLFRCCHVWHGTYNQDGRF